jgi:hypothetical protein
MNKRYLVAGAVVVLLAMIAAAFALDCVRLAAQARRRVELADQELIKHEERLVKLLAASTALSPEVQSAITAYQAPATPAARHAAFDQLLVAFRRSMEHAVDPTNALDRKFMDDIAGAINRREIAEAPYDAETSEYQRYLNGPRGAVALWFSPQDWDEQNPRQQ